ncbi:MAG: Hpt domain-containing protein [Victivallales bacterium]|jgi:hypothetical protein|nr:Hpt domain-containing protein [Victivallales bacterium]
MMNEIFRKHLTETLGIDDVELQDELIAEYKRTFYDTLDKLKEVLPSGDCEQLRRLGHALKGCALNIGDLETKELSLNIENGGKANDVEICRVNIDGLIKQAANLE